MAIAPCTSAYASGAASLTSPARDEIATERFHTSSSSSGPALGASSVTWNTARLTLSGHTGGWWHKGGNRSVGESSCTAGASNFILDLADLSGNTEYTYTAYSDSGCATQLARIIFRTAHAPALTAGSVTASGATLTLSNHKGDWWYDGRDRDGGGAFACAKAAGTSVALTGLNSGSRHSFGAYTDSACTTVNRLDTVTFTTLNPGLTASSVTVTGATLTIANHGGVAWYYKHTNAGATCDGPVAAGTSTKALTGLDAGTSYTYSAYSDSTCTTGNLLATAAQFTTLSSVSNLGSANAGESGISDDREAVAFTTGSNSGGYVLKSVTVPLKKVSGRTGKTVTFTLHEMQGSGQYGQNSQASSTALATLTLSGTLPTDRNAYTNTTFTCSGGGCDLSASTTYFVVAVGNDGSWENWAWSNASAETETALPSGNGWGVGYGHYYTSGGLAWASWGDYNLAQIVFATK